MRTLAISSGKPRPLNNNVFNNTRRVIYATIGCIDYLLSTISVTGPSLIRDTSIMA